MTINSKRRRDVSGDTEIGCRSASLRDWAASVQQASRTNAGFLCERLQLQARIVPPGPWKGRVASRRAQAVQRWLAHIAIDQERVLTPASEITGNAIGRGALAFALGAAGEQNAMRPSGGELLQR